MARKREEETLPYIEGGRRKRAARKGERRRLYLIYKEVRDRERSGKERGGDSTLYIRRRRLYLIYKEAGDRNLETKKERKRKMKKERNHNV